MEIIGLVGPIGSGKDYQANLLVEEGFVKLSFAEEVRQVAWRVLGWTPENSDQYDHFKKAEVSTNISYSNVIYKGVGDRLVETTRYSGKSQLGRQILIDIGDGFRRKFYENIWIDQLIKVIESSGYEKIVISDFRYPNELEVFHDRFPNFKARFCNYKSERYTLLENEPSEALSLFIIQYMNLKDGDLITPNIWRKLI